MLKKLIAWSVLGATLLGGTAALACDCNSPRIYEYKCNGNWQHHVAYYCTNPNCEDPFTVCGYEDCTIPADTPMDEPEICIYCLNRTNIVYP